MSAKKVNTAQAVREIAAPEAEKLGLTLWDVVFVKEGPSWYLRLVIDKPGGVFIEDCETLSRAVDPLIDALDPTEHEYILEVTSPGLGRALRTDAHLDAYFGKAVRLRLFRPDEAGKKEYRGLLQGHDAQRVIYTDAAGEHALPRAEISDIRADDDRDLFGGNDQ